MFELNRKSTVLLVIATLSIVAVGCGGGDGEDAPAPAPVTTTDTASATTVDQLIADGDSFCAEVNAAVGTISSSTTTDAAIRETQISDIYSSLADRLDGLGTPSDGEAPLAVIEAAQALAESTSADGATALETFQSAALEYGFTECGDAPAAPSTSAPVTPVDPGTSTVPVEPAPAPVPVPVDPAPAPGGGVAPDAPAPPSSGGSSSGGISPG